MYFTVCLMFYRISNSSNTEFDLDKINEYDSSDESMLCVKNSKAFIQPINENSSQLKSLGDIIIELKDIVPCMYLHIILRLLICIYKTKQYLNTFIQQLKKLFVILTINIFKYINLGTKSVVVSLFNKNDINTELHLAANKPRDDITVFVVTTRSKCKQPLFDFSFQLVVPNVKRC